MEINAIEKMRDIKLWFDETSTRMIAEVWWNGQLIRHLGLISHIGNLEWHKKDMISFYCKQRIR